MTPEMKGRPRRAFRECSQERLKEMYNPPVNHVVGMQVSQSQQGTVGNGGDFHLLQWFLVNLNGQPKIEMTTCFYYRYLHPKRKEKKKKLPSSKSEAEPRQYSITSF